jgi:hypothetical protein
MWTEILDTNGLTVRRRQFGHAPASNFHLDSVQVANNRRMIRF